ncbi:MAG: hypothetical protein DA408_21425 [Bacteroidetes bacterium]|nr:MAG: hypothetical protein C7N36_20150 [Bacteroidota bacterium]PTM07853.1 MAG: hypothetical protein DA408_21425 [Bacteroidota bacterium]
MNRFLPFFCLITLASLTELSAQMVAKSPFAAHAAVEMTELPTNDWSIYADEESNTYFIDFEQLAVNLNKVLVKGANGQVIWQDEVFDLPVNSIYELDFSSYAAGEYIIELQAFTGVIRKKVAYKL